MPCIDLHCHVVPAQFPPYRGSTPNPAWPSMEHDGCGHAKVMISGKNFRTVTEQAWSLEKRLSDMAEMRIARQVLSPMPELLSYWLPLDDANVLLRHVNEWIAEKVVTDPAHFLGLGGVPLQDVDVAIKELEYIVKELGLSGVEIGPNVNGVSIGDPRFEPFFAAAEQMGAAIFIHAMRPAGKDRLVGPAVLEQIVGFPCEMGLGVAALMTSGLLERHPNLRIACSHGGGTFALVLARMQGTWHRVEALQKAMPKQPREYARRLYYDTCVFDLDALRFLLTSFGEDRLIIGTDYPFGIYERDPVGFLHRTGISEHALAAVGHENAKRFLKLN